MINRLKTVPGIVVTATAIVTAIGDFKRHCCVVVTGEVLVAKLATCT